MLATGWPSGSAAGAIDGVDRDGGQAELLRSLDHVGAAAALVFHLVLDFVDLGARAFGRDFLLHLCRDAFKRRRHARLDLADLDQRHAEPALHRLADFARRQRKRRIRNRRIDDRGFCDHAEVDVGQIEIALLGEVVERRSRRDAAARGLRFPFVGKHDLRDFALLRRAELVAVLLEDLLRVLVGDFGPFADLFGVDHDKRQLAIFGRAELGLVVLEIGGQRLGRGRIDRAGLRGVELDVFDRALLVLEAGQRVDQHLRRLDAGRDGAGDLAPQPDAPLFGEIALFGVAELADRGLEACRVELAAQSLEIGVAVDQPHGLFLGLGEPHAPCFLVERGFGDGLLQHLPVKPEGAGLFRGQRTAETAAELLQLVGVDLAELLGRNLGAADLGQRRLAESLEDVGDAPNCETDNQNAHHDGHDNLAEPV